MVNPIITATKHAVLRTISVICVLAIIALLGLGVKRIIYPPKTESYAQKAENIVNNEQNYYYSKPDDRFFLGLSLWQWRIGLTWQGKQDVK